MIRKMYPWVKFMSNTHLLPKQLVEDSKLVTITLKIISEAKYVDKINIQSVIHELYK